MKPLIFFSCLGIACAPQNQVAQLTHDAKTVISVDSTGISAQPYYFSPDQLFPKTNWQGDWIWLNESQYPDFQETRTVWINSQQPCLYRAQFRKEFDLREIPAQALLCLTADVSFRAYLNGHFIGQGPANIGSDYEDTRPPEHWFFAIHDVRRHLQTGKNILAVEVYAFDLALSEITSGAGKLICDLDTGVDQTLLSTDTTWKCQVDTSISRMNGALVFDATQASPDWEKFDFDDQHWSNASVKTAPKTCYLTPSQIPVPLRHPLPATKIWRQAETSPVEAVGPDALIGQDWHHERFTLDFNQNLSAYYTFEVTADAGDTLKFFPREKNSPNRSLVYICRTGKNHFTTPQLNVFRYLTVEISSDNGLKFDSLHVLYSSYPVDYAGSFACSDSFFTELWDIARWTTQMCMQDLHLDSPMHQEPLACTGDYLIESLSNYYAFGDPWLARQDLIKTARMLQKNGYDMFHTSYSLLWVQMLDNYFQFTGDAQLVHDLLPHVNRLNDLFATYLDENYLVSQAPDYMFMDWIKINKFNAHHPPAVIGMGYLTAFYYQSLRLAAGFNTLAGDQKQSRKNLELAEKIKNGMNQWLWDESKGVYKDGVAFKSRVQPHHWLPADEAIVTHSPHVNTLAVLYDMAPVDRRHKILDYVLHQQEIDLQPYFSYFVLSALVHLGRFEPDGLTFIRKWQNGIDLETHTLKENWQDQTEFGYGGDFSHAWGGSPLIFLSRQILGITPAAPGFTTVRFVPCVSQQITWAKGTVPLTAGNAVSVGWERAGQTKYTYRIQVPHPVILEPPAALIGYELHVNEKTYGKTTKPVELSAGDYVIEFTNGDK